MMRKLIYEKNILKLFFVYSFVVYSIAVVGCKSSTTPETPTPEPVKASLAGTLSFEEATLDINITDFDGGMGSVVDNPKTTGNSSSKVLKYVKNAGQVWGGVYITFDNAIDFSSNKGFQFKVWNAKVVGTEVTVKFENGSDSSIYSEKTIATTKSQEWETLTVDFNDIDTTQEYHKLIIIMDNGTMGAGEEYYFDDMELVAIPTSSYGSLPLGFESGEYAYQFDDQDGGAFGNATVEIGDNPSVTGNSSAKVAKFTKSAGAEVWAGFYVKLTDDIDFSTQKKITAKVYSPAVGTDVTVYVEERYGDYTTQVKQSVATTVANQWETLTFDFSSIDTTKQYNKMGFQFNNTEAGDGSVYYIDDVAQGN